MDEDMSRDRHATGVDRNGSTSQDLPADRVTVPEAAELMGVTQSAVRKRVQRGTIPWDKDREGRIYVYVDPSETRPDTGEDRARDTDTGQSRDEVLEAYKDQVEFLHRELERKDTIIISLTQRIPELEPAPEASQGLQTPVEGGRVRIQHLPQRSSRRSAPGGGSSSGWSNRRWARSRRS